MWLGISGVVGTGGGGGEARDRHVVRRIGGPVGLRDGADRGAVVAAGLLEATEVVGSGEKGGGLVHRADVQGPGAVVGPHFDEGVFGPVKEIRIFASCSAEPGVKVPACGPNGVDDYAPGQNGI